MAPRKMNVPVNAANLVRRSDGWANVYTALGSVSRDKRRGASFVPETLSEQECEALWEGDDCAARIIETEPQEMLRDGYEVHIPGGEDESEISDWLTGKNDELNVAAHMVSAMEIARGLGGSAIYVGVDDGQKDQSKPVNMESIRGVRHMTVLRPSECMPVAYYDNPANPKYGEPAIYRIQRETMGGGYARAVEVHETRLVRFFGDRTSRRQLARNGGWGNSVLVRCIEPLRDFQAAFGSTSHIMTDFAQAVFKIEGLAELMAAGDDESIIKRAQAIDTARSVARALLIDKNEEFKREMTPLTGVPEVLQQMALRLAGASKTPVVIFMGSSPSGLNATGAADVRIWYAQVSKSREKVLRPRLNYVTKLLLMSRESPTAGVEPENWKLCFPSLWQPTAQEEADLRNKQALTDEIYIRNQVLTPEEVALSRFGGEEWSADTSIEKKSRELNMKALPSSTEAEAPVGEDDDGEESGSAP